MRLSSRTIPGVLNVHNKGTLDWSCNGLIAYGCANILAVLDSRTLQTLQGLNGHKTAVTKVRWMPSSHAGDSVRTRSLYVASADTGGAINVWDVYAGCLKSTFVENNKVVNGMEWLLHGTSSYVLALYQSSVLALWNSLSGEQVWKKSYGENLIGFSLDPFNASSAAFQGIGYVMFVDDLNVYKCPASSGKRFQVSGLSSASSAADREVAGRDYSQLLYHKAYRDHILLISGQEIMLIDLGINQTVGVITLDKTISPFLQVFSSRQRDVIYSLHDNGCVSMRARKRLPAADACISDSGSTRPDACSLLMTTDQAQDFLYESMLTTDSPRLTRSQRVVAMAVCPVTEIKVAVLTSDGKLMIWDVQKEPDWSIAWPCSSTLSGLACPPSEGLPAPVCSLADLMRPSTCDSGATSSRGRLWATLVGVTNGLPEPPLIVKMCPPLTTRNWNVYQPLVAVGSHRGFVQVYNLSNGQLQKELSVHSCQVRGIEWSSMSSVITFANEAVSGGMSARSDVAHVDFKTGRVNVLRTTNTDDATVTSIRVSYLRQYLIIMYKNKPAELWDVRTCTLLRDMPPTFPYAMAVEWSNTARRLLAVESAGTHDSPSPHALVREHLLLVDPVGFVHRYTVEGTAVSGTANIPVEGHITAMAWKTELLVLGSAEGDLSFFDLKARTTQTKATNKGVVRKLRFSPGKGNTMVLVLLNKELQIWDAKETTMVSSLRFPKDISRVTDTDWASLDTPILSTADGYVVVTKIDLKTSNSSLAELAPEDFSSCTALLSADERIAAKTLLCHQPWNARFAIDSEDGSSMAVAESTSRSASALAKCLPRRLREYFPMCRLGIPERCLIVARMLGDSFEADFWTVALHYIQANNSSNGKDEQTNVSIGEIGIPSAAAELGAESESAPLGAVAVCRRGGNNLPLETCYDVFCDNESFRATELARVMLHDSKREAGSGDEVGCRCAAKYVQLGETDRAVHLLLETDPASPQYLTNCLKACLLTSVRSSGASLSTMKLVATNLIASGKLAEGVQLLCLIDKGLDACRYLQTYSLWEESVQLAKMLLGPSESADVIGRWIDHLCSPSVLMKEKAILAALSTAQFLRVIELLYGCHCFTLAALFTEVCNKYKLLDNTERTLSVTEAVFLQYARILQELKLLAAARYYLVKAGDRGEQLLSQLNAPAADS